MATPRRAPAWAVMRLPARAERTTPGATPALIRCKIGRGEGSDREVCMLRSAALAVACLLLSVTAHAVTFADGLVHVIDGSDSFPVEGVIVLDPPQRP